MFRKKKEANEILRYAIKMLRGGCCRCSPGIRLSLILRLKDDLENLGAKWQSRCLIWHLHKAQKGFMTTQKDKGGV